VGVRKRATEALLLEAVCLLPRTVLWALIGLDIMLAAVSCRAVNIGRSRL